MKTAIKFQTIAITALAILTTACSKNDFCNESEYSEKTRTITATFDNSDTKTTIDDNLTPLWVAGNKIWISDGTKVLTITLVTSNPDFEEAQISSDGKSFSFNLPIEGWGETIYSVYPASCATGSASESGIGITIPSAQGGTFGNANICVAQGTSTLSYKNATSIIKVTESNAGANDYMFFTAGTSAIAGTFTASIDGSNVSLTAGATTSTIGGKVQSGVSYYAIAPCESPNLTLKARQTTGNRKFAEKAYTHGSYTFDVNTIYHLAMPAFTSEQYTESIIVGEFSVSATKKVEFSPANLYWDGSAWKFETKQLDYPSSWDPNHVGHLYWTNLSDYQSGENYLMPYAYDYCSYEYTTSDKFFCGEDNKLSVNESDAVWYALSKDEWKYLIDRDNASGNALCQNLVTIMGVENCTVIAPDGYAGELEDSYDADAWATAEAEGLVCLPPAGYRYCSYFYNCGGGGEEGYAYSWSSTPYDDDESFVYYCGDMSYTNRSDGSSVRLVR